VQIESIRKYCLSFPQARENLQWGAELCFKVGGKIFAILSLDSVPQRLCFKCTPQRFEELLEREHIQPAPYLGRYKWVMLERLNALPPTEARELIGESYAMIAAKVRGSARGKRVSKSKIGKKAK